MHSLRWVVIIAVTCLWSVVSFESAAIADPGPEALAQARKAYDQGNWSQAGPLYAKAYEQSPKNSVSRVEAALEHGAMLWEQGNYKPAHKKVSTAYQLAKKLKINRALGRLLLTLGQIETSQGKLGTAQKTLQLCVVETKVQKDTIYGSLCTLSISLVRRLRGKAGLSDASIKRTIASLKNTQTPRAAGLAMAKTADLYRKSNNHAQAMQLLVQAQAQFKKAGSVPAQTRNLLRMGAIFQDQGQWANAQAKVQAAMPALQKMNNKPLLQQAYGMMGRAAQQTGQSDKAQQYFVKSLSYAKATGSPQLKAQSHLALCELLSSPKPQNTAEAYCSKAASGFKRIGARVLYVRAVVRLANINQQKRQLPTARKMYMESVSILEKSPKTAENKSVLATQYANLCQVEHSLNYTGSYKTCVKALGALSKQPSTDKAYMAATHYAAAFGAQREKRFKNAITHFDQAGKIYVSLSQPNWMRAADARLRLGTLLTQLKGKEKQAIAALTEGLKWAANASAGQAQPVKQELLLQLSQHFLMEKQYNKAVTHLERLIQIATKDPDTQAWAYNGLAHAKLKLGDQAAAIASLEKGLVAVSKGRDKHKIKALMRKNLKILKK